MQKPSKIIEPHYIEHFCAGLVSIIIPVLCLHRRRSLRYGFRKLYRLPDILEDIKNISMPHETIIVCNSKDTDLINFIYNCPMIDKYCLNSTNVGVARAWNMGAMLAEGEYLCFSNDDVELGEGALERLIEVMASSEEIGQVGPRGGKYRGAFAQRKVGVNSIEEADEISGFFFVMKRKVFDLVGGFDVAFTPAGYEETDMSFKIRNIGYKCLIVPHLNIEHHNELGVSNWKNKYIKYFNNSISTEHLTRRNIAVFQKKWFDTLED